LSGTCVAQESDFFIIHTYFWNGYANGNRPTNQQLFDQLSELSTIRSGVDSLIKKYAPSVTKRMPIALTEYNIEIPPCGATLQYINTIWFAELFGEVIKGGTIDCLVHFAFKVDCLALPFD